MTKSEKRLVGAAKEAVAIARGQKKPARLKVPPEIDVKAIRTKLSISQKDFAAEFGFTYDQVKAWEQKRFRPQGGARAYLLIIERDPNAVLAILRQVARATRREQR